MAVKLYSEKYDAFYDGITGEWLEPKCGDENCEFCKDRPEKNFRIYEDEKNEILEGNPRK